MLRAYVCRWGRIAGLSTALQISHALVQATVVPPAPYLWMNCDGGFAAMPGNALNERAWVCRWGPIAELSTVYGQATVGVGTVIIVYIRVAYTRGGGVPLWVWNAHFKCGHEREDCKSQQHQKWLKVGAAFPAQHNRAAWSQLSRSQGVPDC